MDKLLPHIRNCVQNNVPEDYEKVLVFAEVGEGVVDGFVNHSKNRKKVIYQDFEFEEILNMIGRVWDTYKAKRSPPLWSGIIYFLDGDNESYELLYEEEIQFHSLSPDFCMNLRNRFFPGYSLKGIVRGNQP